jgi:eukaryotic-like serine/threonine-protein kinase
MSSDPFCIVGTIVDGRYRVERMAGQGGFGVVYRAYHLAFESAIALKVLKLPEHWLPETKRARIASFQREGRMLFKLSTLHPAIVRAFETGTIAAGDGSLAPYLALEWLDGVSLDHELKYRRKHGLAPMSLPQVLSLLDAPATALGRAHDGGVVHRDIKPGNLFASTQGSESTVKVLDFGIAKVVHDSAEVSAQLSGGAGVTSSFTPMYAAPEQWLTRLGTTGAWTDVHGWALVCVELLTNKLPLTGREAAQFMAACLDPDHRPTPLAHGLELPSKVEAVFARALALDPSDRFPDARTFWSNLCEAASWSPEQAEPVEMASLRGAQTDRESNTLTPTLAPTELRTQTSTTAARRSTQRRLPAPRLRGWRLGGVLLALGLGMLMAETGVKASRSARPNTKPSAVTSVSWLRTNQPASHATEPPEPSRSPPTTATAEDAVPSSEPSSPERNKSPSDPRSRERSRRSQPPAAPVDPWDQRL